MKKSEIYRSFEGKLGVEQQRGYILYELADGELIEYESISVWEDEHTEHARIPSRFLPASEYSNINKIAELVADCYYGNLAGGQIFFRGKWWSYDTIRKIQQKNRDNCWHRYV